MALLWHVGTHAKDTFFWVIESFWSKISDYWNSKTTKIPCVKVEACAFKSCLCLWTCAAGFCSGLRQEFLWIPWVQHKLCSRFAGWPWPRSSGPGHVKPGLGNWSSRSAPWISQVHPAMHILPTSSNQFWAVLNAMQNANKAAEEEVLSHLRADHLHSATMHVQFWKKHTLRISCTTRPHCDFANCVSIVRYETDHFSWSCPVVFWCVLYQRCPDCIWLSERAVCPPLGQYTDLCISLYHAARVSSYYIITQWSLYTCGMLSIPSPKHWFQILHTSASRDKHIGGCKKALDINARLQKLCLMKRPCVCTEFSNLPGWWTS